MDLVPWPGPSEETEWEQTLYLTKTQFAIVARAFGKMYKNIEDAMQLLNFGLVEMSPPPVRGYTPTPHKKGQPQRTFDRTGRRLR